MDLGFRLRSVGQRTNYSDGVFTNSVMVATLQSRLFVVRDLVLKGWDADGIVNIFISRYDEF